MARIFRQTYTKPTPECAEIFTRKGKKYARFKDRKGKTIIAELSKDGNLIIRETAKWYIEYKGNDGTMKRVAGYTDKIATEQKAAEIVRQEERVHSGEGPRPQFFLFLREREGVRAYSQARGRYPASCTPSIYL